MTEKVVAIYVTREFRNKIKAEKHELTYEKFLNNLIKGSAIKPSPSIEPLKETCQKKGNFDR